MLLNPIEVDIIGMLGQGGFLHFAFAKNATKWSTHKGHKTVVVILMSLWSR
jgi:hypothetical protein